MSENIKAKNEIDMTNGPILKKMLVFSVPVILSGILQIAFNAADVIVVGRFAGDDCLAAVGTASSPCFLVINLILGLATGVNVVVGRAYGAGKSKDIHEAVHTSILLSLIGGFIMMIIGLLVCRSLLNIINVPDNIMDLTVSYLYILFAGIPVMAVYNFGSAILRAKGDTRRPLEYLAIAGVLNIILNLLFVIEFNLAVVGVALATVLSQCVSMFLVIRALKNEDGPFKLVFRDMKLHASKVKPICMTGIPAGIQGMFFSISNMAIQSAINTFGEIAMAGSSAACSIENFTFTAMDGFSQAAVSFSSQNMGAGKYKRINKVLITASLCSITCGVVLGLSTYIFGRTLLGIYSTSEAVIDQGMIRLFYICIPYALCGLMNVIPGVLRGMGYSIGPTIITLLGTCFLRVIWVKVFCILPAFDTINWVYISYPCTWIITAMAHFVLYRWAYKKICNKKNSHENL